MVISLDLPDEGDGGHDGGESVAGVRAESAADGVTSDSDTAGQGDGAA